MRKKFHILSFSILTLSFLYVIFPQAAHASLLPSVQDVVAFLSAMVLRLFAWVLGASAYLLNKVLEMTVVNMAENYAQLAAIDSAWAVVRDIGNMFFIFILIYAAIKTILGVGTRMQETIKNIVIAAISVNFSLFFTKIVIDASNILTLLFYNAMKGANTGLADSIMQPLGLQNLYQTGSTISSFEVHNILIVTVMGTVLFLIAAAVFITVAILFIVRYIALIFVLILSPLYFLSLALPNAFGQYQKKWVEALKNQAFFAPIYMFLTWIALYVIKGMDLKDHLGATAAASLSGAADPHTAVSLILNFCIVIGIIIFALITAKDMASKGAAGSLTKWATGVSGGLTVGMAGRLGRNTLGRAGVMVSESGRLKDAVAEGGMKGAAARLALAAGSKTSKASFDVRATKFGSGLDMGKAQKGGFDQTLKEKKKSEEAISKSLDASDREKEEAKLTVKMRELDLAKFNKGTAEHTAAQAELDRAKANLDKLQGVNEEEAKKRLREKYGVKNDKELKASLGDNYDKEVKSAQVKSIGEERRETRLNTLQNSPTFRAARVIENLNNTSVSLSDVKSGTVNAARAGYKTIVNAPQTIKDASQRVAESRKNISADNIKQTIKQSLKADLTFANEIAEGISEAIHSTAEQLPHMIRMKNAAAISELRKTMKKKESAKDLIDKALKATGEKDEEESPDTSKTPKPDEAGGETPKTT